MEYLRTSTYEIKKGTFQEVAEAARGGMLKTFRQQTGFIRYGLADVGDKKCLSISLWDTHKDADAAVPVAANWVRENLSDRVELRSTSIGDLAEPSSGGLARGPHEPPPRGVVREPRV